MSKISREQATIPSFEPEVRDVYWLHAEQVAERYRIFGKRVVTQFVLSPDRRLPTTISISADDINKVQDPQLRYALRFLDASNAASWNYDDPVSSTCTDVQISATNESFDSKLLSVHYYPSGTLPDGTDAFLEQLHRFAPDYDHLQQ